MKFVVMDGDVVIELVLICSCIVGECGDSCDRSESFN